MYQKPLDLLGIGEKEKPLLTVTAFYCGPDRNHGIMVTAPQLL
jgi:hypothetical protein